MQVTSPTLAPRPDSGVVEDLLGGIWEGGGASEMSSGPDHIPPLGGVVGDMLGDAVSEVVGNMLGDVVEATSSASAGHSGGRDELDELFGGALPPSPASTSGTQSGSGSSASVVDLLS